MMKFWEFLNNKKTNIGMFLVILAQLLIRVVIPELPEDLTWVPNLAQWMNDFGIGLGGVGLTHKVVKTKKGPSVG